MKPNGNKAAWIDITVTLHDDMVHWPTDPAVSIKRIHDMEQGYGNNLSAISMGAHTGTHMDAPLHFIQQGRGIDQMPPDIAMGRARVIEIKDTESIKPEELEQHRIRRGERILFRTPNSPNIWKSDAFIDDFVFVSNEAARFLVKCGIKLVGVDYLSVGGYHVDGAQIHQTLLGGGIWLLEGLDLSLVTAGYYDLICLPLRIRQGDGAPARAILRPV